MAPMSSGPTNWPMGKPVWWVPTANPRSSFCHHSPTIVTFTGSIEPVPMPIKTRRARSWFKVLEIAVPTAATTTTATVAAHIHARRSPFPKLSPSVPRTIAPMVVPTKLKETKNPPSVALRLNSLIIPGSTVGRIIRSMELTTIARVVITSIIQETGCARGV